MRTPRSAMTVLGAALLVLFGCKSSEPELKPPKIKEVYALPSDDARFSDPPTFPKEKQADFLDNKHKQDTAGPGMPGAGGAGGSGMSSGMPSAGMGH